MKLVTRLMKVAALGLAVSASAAMAQEATTAPAATEVQYTPEQLAVLQDCDFANSIFVDIAVARQSGMSKEEAKKQLEDYIQGLMKEAPADQQESVKGLGDLWRGGFDGIYDMEIQATNEGKAAAVKAVYQQNMQLCVAEVSAVRNVTFDQ